MADSAAADRLAVLFGLRLKGFAAADAIAELVDVSAGESVAVSADRCGAQLAAAEDEGLAVHRQGRSAGWMLTPTGRAEVAKLVAAELDESGARPAVQDAYQRFLGINVACLALCTDWQLLDAVTLRAGAERHPARELSSPDGAEKGEEAVLVRACSPSASGPLGPRPRLSARPLNDHTDPAYDAAVVARLGVLDDQAQPICADLAAALGRFAGYGHRLAEARRRVEAGDVDWFTKPVIDSYHTVWFELHEAQLVTLDIERSQEVG